jgi:site-specific DNA-cytosine methylase
MREALGLDGEVYTQRNPETAKGGNRWVPTSEPSTTVSCVGKPQIRPRREALGVEAFCFATHPEGAEGVADRRVRSLSDGPCPTIGAEYTGTLAGHPRIAAADGETGRRRLTVAECAVLQDFPAGHPWQGGVGAQYRQVGNAVPPRLAEVVGRALMTAIADVRGLS